MKPHDGPWPTEPRWNEPATDPALTTIGLPRELAPLATWADSLGLLGPLLLIIDSANVAAFPAQAGTVLGFSRQRVPAELVRSWQLEKPFLPELVQLLEASSVAAAVYRDYPAMPAARPRSQALSGGMLGELPLVALVSCPLPLLSGDTERQFWIEALRTWCFVHWLEAAYRGSGENAYLVTVTNKLRQGMDGDEHWLELFSSLLGPTDSLAAMTRHLSSAAKSALTQPKGSVRRPSHDQLLAHLRNFCEGKAPPDAGDRSYRPGLFQLLAPRLATASAPWPLPAGSVPLDSTQTQDAAFPSASILDLPHRESLVVAVDVDDSLTPSQQDVAAKGVLLASIEQYQYLPFSWDHPSPFEREALESWIAAGLDSAQPQLRQLACGAWLAIHTATSLRTLMALGIGEDPDDDWRVGLASGRLHRKPPRRYNGWRARKESLDWIHPLADRIELSLPPAVRQVLEELSRDARSTSSTVGNLFQSVDLEEHFRREMLHIPDLHRVTSGMLARWQPQALFDATLDPVFSQLVSSHPRSGLPGACAYASYSKSYVTHQLLACVASKVNAHNPDEEPEHNAAGSQLSPIDALLRQAFDDARTAVNELARDSNKWIDHHNALVTYGTLILLTVTAARPVSSPFEDISWVDLENLSIFVRDKQASAGHTGRLLPLPQQAAEFIQLTLLPHFARLAQLLEPIDPTMAAEVAKLAARQVSSRLPFLFMLSCDPHLAWTEVTETTLRAVGIFRWPLPWNLMRHRATTSLKALGCDHEVVNALMDHGEYGTAAYGPYSPRVWGHDARSAAPKVACLIEQLRLGEIQSPQWNIGKATAVPKPEGGSALSHTDRYGHAARAQARSATKNAAIEQVHREIEAFLAGRKADAIAGADWDKLLQSMLVQPNGLPHPMGSVRYDELLTWLRQRWNTEDLRLGLKRRYCPALEEPSHFTPSCIGATRLLAQAQDHLRQRLEKAAPRTISLRQCLAWFTLSLVIESRIADLRVLKDALGNANVRVVRMQGNLYLEHGPTLDRFPDSPAKRYRLSRHAALLIDRAKSSTRNLHAGKLPVGTKFLGLAAAAGISASAELTVHALIQQLAAITDQANARELPGVLTGYLNGTVVSAALTHTDWIRCQKGEAAVAPSWTAARKALEDTEDPPAASDESTALSRVADFSPVVVVQISPPGWDALSS